MKLKIFFLFIFVLIFSLPIFNSTSYYRNTKIIKTIYLYKHQIVSYNVNIWYSTGFMPVIQDPIQEAYVKTIGRFKKPDCVVYVCLDKNLKTNKFFNSEHSIASTGYLENVKFDSSSLKFTYTTERYSTDFVEYFFIKNNTIDPVQYVEICKNEKGYFYKYYRDTKCVDKCTNCPKDKNCINTHPYKYFQCIGMHRSKYFQDSVEMINNFNSRVKNNIKSNYQLIPDSVYFSYYAF